MTRPENKLYAAWRDAEGDAKKALEDSLVRVLRRYATKICWILLKQNNADVVNTAVYQALMFSGGFREEARFSTWFYSIVRNLCTNEQRTRARRREISFEDLSRRQVESLPTVQISDEVIALREAVGKLGATEYEFLQMMSNGAPEAEMVEKFKLSPVGIRVRWSRLKQKIKAEMNV